MCGLWEEGRLKWQWPGFTCNMMLFKGFFFFFTSLKKWNCHGNQKPGADIMEADDCQVTAVFTVQPSFHHRLSTNQVWWSITVKTVVTWWLSASMILAPGYFSMAREISQILQSRQVVAKFIVFWGRVCHPPRKCSWNGSFVLSWSGFVYCTLELQRRIFSWCTLMRMAFLFLFAFFFFFFFF